MLTEAEVEAVMAERKVIAANLRWRPEGPNYRLEATVLAPESRRTLKLMEHLAREFECRQEGQVCYVTTPFLRPDGEYIELQVSLQGSPIATDMGDTLGYLYVNGLTLSRGIIEEVRRLCARFGVDFRRPELVTPLEDPGETGDALHRLIQAVLSTTEPVQRRRPSQRLNFDVEVESLLILSGVTYDERYQVQGATKPHTVRFHVDSHRRLLIQPLSVASQPQAFAWAERWAYRFYDILKRDEGWRCLAVLDDRGGRSQAWDETARAPIQEFAIPWSQREKLEEQLRT